MRRGHAALEPYSAGTLDLVFLAVFISAFCLSSEKGRRYLLPLSSGLRAK